MRIKFLASNVHFSSLSPDPLSSKRSAHAGIKEGYFISGYLTAIGLCSVKTVTDSLR